MAKGLPPNSIKTVDDDCEIVLYKRGSYGEVVAIYKTINDWYMDESKYNSVISASVLKVHIKGGTKSFKSLAHQCVVKAVIRKTA